MVKIGTRLLVNDIQCMELRKRHDGKHKDNDDNNDDYDDRVINDDAINEGERLANHNSDDPLKWFGILVPQSLRNSQKIFTSGILIKVKLELNNYCKSVVHHCRYIYCSNQTWAITG